MTPFDYPSPWVTGIQTPRRLSMATGHRGMVATGHPLATLTGLEVLAAGGNAVDASLAAAGILAVAQPMMSGVGGDAFILYYDAQKGQIWAINGSGRAPRLASRQRYLDAGYEAVPMEGMLSVTVPGAVDAYWEAHSRWGSMALRDLWQPAIAYARNGVPVSERVSEWIAWAAPRLRQFPESARVYLPEGKPPSVGDRLVQVDLAATLDKIAMAGAETFYRGEIASKIAAYSKARGGFLGFEDLAEHKTTIYEPLVTRYRGVDVYETAPPSQGFILLEMLNLMEEFDLAAAGPGSADSVHIMVESKKVAFSDRDAHFGDPDFHENPLSTVLNKAYAKRRAAEIALRKARMEGYASLSPGETTYLCVVDERFNAVSLVASLSGAFGCGDIVPGTGVVLTNRAGQSFTLREGHVNCIGGSKRPMHTLNCFIGMRRGLPYLVGGTSGGDAQPQWNAQVISNVIDHGMKVQEAIQAPRWWSLPGTEPGYHIKPPILVMEEGFDLAARNDLTSRGHQVLTVPFLFVGSGFQMIEVDTSRGILFGGTDFRGEGCALGR